MAPKLLRMHKTPWAWFCRRTSRVPGGYAAVKEGMTQLGFLGGKAQPGIVRYGYGFVQGAEYAAQQMGIAAGSVTVQYAYTGSFDESNDTQSLAAGWYGAGTECILPAEEP